MPLACIASTIWSLSACTTRGSLAPWPISSGLLLLSTWVIGERSSSSCLPSSVSGSPTLLYPCSMKLAQSAGNVLDRVTRLDGPTRSTPHAKVSGDRHSGVWGQGETDRVVFGGGRR